MLNQTFQFLPGARDVTEQHLWSQGVTDWEGMLHTSHIPGVSAERLLFWKGRLRQAHALSIARDYRAIARILPARILWRMYPELTDNPRFLDIETTERRLDITVVGVSDGEFYQPFIKGRNLHLSALRRALEGASCIITFNGASFDLPILKRRFPMAIPAVPHLDLRYVCAQGGLFGGLKRIEEQLGITRPGGIRYLDGADAILLWYRYLLGEVRAVDELVEYNAADVLNLVTLAERVIPPLWLHVRHKAPLPWTSLPKVSRAAFL